MDSNLTLFAGFAGLTALWSQIRGFFDRLRALFVTRVTLNGEIATIVTHYLYTHCKVLNWGDRYIRSNSAWVRPLDRVAEVAYEHAPMQPLIAWLHRRPILFHCPRQHYNGGQSNTPDNHEILILTGLRGCLDIVALTRAALTEAQNRQSTGRRYFIRRISEALGKPIPGTRGTTRPGRLDAAFCLEMPNQGQRLTILYRIIGQENVKTFHLDQTAGMTAAQVTDYAITHALAHTWNS